MARANAFWPTAVVGEADSVNSVSASACHIGGPKGVSPGQKALLHGMNYLEKIILIQVRYKMSSHSRSEILSLTTLSVTLAIENR